MPVWHESRRLLPFVFAAEAAASAGGALTALMPVVAAAPARRLAIALTVTLTPTDARRRAPAGHSLATWLVDRRGRLRALYSDVPVAADLAHDLDAVLS